MIHHLSIAARDPKHAAGVLAELMGGTAVPFPPNPGSFFALQLDEHGSGVEVYPAGTELQPGGEVGGNFVKTEARGYGSTHFALSARLTPMLFSRSLGAPGGTALIAIAARSM
jgi:hypothetical protein